MTETALNGMQIRLMAKRDTATATQLFEIWQLRLGGPDNNHPVTHFSRLLNQVTPAKC